MQHVKEVLLFNQILKKIKENFKNIFKTRFQFQSCFLISTLDIYKEQKFLF